MFVNIARKAFCCLRSLVRGGYALLIHFHDFSLHAALIVRLIVPSSFPHERRVFPIFEAVLCIQVVLSDRFRKVMKKCSSARLR